MKTVIRIAAGVLIASTMVIGPAWATGSAIQQLRSTEGLRTSGQSGVGNSTGIYTRHQRRKFGYGPSSRRLAPPR